MKADVVALAALKSNNFHMGIMLLERNILEMEKLEAANRVSVPSPVPPPPPVLLLLLLPFFLLLMLLLLLLQDQHKRSTRGGDDVRPLYAKQLDAHWHQLGILYRALGEDDIFMGIFEHNAKVPETKQALRYLPSSLLLYFLVVFVFSIFCSFFSLLRFESTGDYQTALKTYDAALDQLSAHKITPPPPPAEVRFFIFTSSPPFCLLIFPPLPLLIRVLLSPSFAFIASVDDVGQQSSRVLDEADGMG